MYRTILLLTAVLGIVYGYPSGPPVDTVKGLCDAMDPTGHGPSKATEEPPYAISVSSTTYSANTTIQVSVKVTSDDEHFEGLFVQARRQDAERGSITEPLGLYSDPPSGTKLLKCNGVKGSAWGHKDAKKKTEATITWTAPDDEGPLNFVATIVKGPKDIYWMDVKSSQLTYDAEKTKRGVVNEEARQRLLWKYRKL